MGHAATSAASPLGIDGVFFRRAVAISVTTCGAGRTTCRTPMLLDHNADAAIRVCVLHRLRRGASIGRSGVRACRTGIIAFGILAALYDGASDRSPGACRSGNTQNNGRGQKVHRLEHGDFPLKWTASVRRYRGISK
jgi:hypothetical protein